MFNLYKRLMQHKGAKIGLVILITSISIVLYSFISTSLDPYTIRPWLIGKPPLTTAPNCLAENNFTVGQKLTGHFKDVKSSIDFFVHPTQSSEFRILTKDDKISSIWDLKSSKKIKQLEVEPEGRVTLTQLFKNKISSHITNGLLIKLGQPIPKQIQPVDGVAILKKEKWDISSQNIHIIIKDHRVQQITSNQKPILSISIKGEQVVSLRVDQKNQTNTFILGTDILGRDLLARVIYGGRVSLMIAAVATLVSLIIGVFYGAIAGYAGGKIERVMMNGVDILYAVPFMFLVIILLVNFGRNIVVLFIALGAVQWLTMSRIVCSVTRGLAKSEFIEAAKLSGASRTQIILNHLLPNMTAPIIVYATLTIPAVILEESFLSFIGLSVQYGGKTLDSWGTLVFQGIEALGSNGSRLWILLAPATAMVVTLIGFNLLGDGLRDILDPKRPTK